MAYTFPFAAIVGQDEMKLAILMAAVDPSMGGVLVLGDRGTGKSTAVRALAALLPPMKVVSGCPYGCDPAQPGRGMPRENQHPVTALCRISVVSPDHGTARLYDGWGCDSSRRC